MKNANGPGGGPSAEWGLQNPGKEHTIPRGGRVQVKKKWQKMGKVRKNKGETQKKERAV